jgi:autotransporter-associated beta strand protein
MGSVSGTDVLTIADGQTLTVNSNDGTTTAVQGNSTKNAFRIGGNVSPSNVTTTAIITGGGTLNINSPSANFAMDNVINPDGGVVGNVVADMSGLAHFIANVANFRVGFGQRAQATLTLSNDSNITAGVFTVGDSNGLNSSTGLSSLIFGQSTVINATTINFGNSKAQAVGYFNSGLTNPTLKIRGLTGDDASSADLNIAVLTATGAQPGLSSLIFDAGTGRSDGILDAKFNNIVIGKGSLSGLSGVAQGLFEFDNGTVTANTIKLGVAVDGSTGTATNTGTFNVKGGSLTAGTVTLGTVGTSTQKAVGVFNITGGSVTMTGDIIDGGGTSTLNLNGGSLDMAGHNIGSDTQNVDTVTLASGTLQNVAEINNGGAVTKTTAGLLVLTGNNTYTGATNVSAGTLQVGSGGTGQSGSGNVTVNGTGAALAGTGSVRGATTVTSGVIRPGDNAGAGVGTLSITSSLTMNPASASTVGEFTILNHTTSDNINITGDLSLNGNSNFVVTFDSGYTPTMGDTWHLLDWAGSLTLNGFSTGTNLRTGNNADANEGNLDLPDIGPLGQWSVSQLADGSGGGALVISIVNVPEPGRAMLLMVGLGSLVLRRRRPRLAGAHA